MQKEQTYNFTRFSTDVLSEAYNFFISTLKSVYKEFDENKLYIKMLLKHDDQSTWQYDDVNDFFSDYRKYYKNYARFRIDYEKFELDIVNYSTNIATEVCIKAPEKSKISALSELFEKHLEKSKIEIPHIKPTIFIGHGRSNQWRDLKDHLQDKHGYEIEAFESGARAGHTIRDILEEMIAKSSFAFLILTAEDEQNDGSFRGRQNVVHEAGLFQGKLGFHKAIVLLEEGTEEFSNINGIQQIRFSKNNIKEIFGEALATLKREFG